MAEPPTDVLDRARIEAGLSHEELWLRYFALGGMSTEVQLEAFLYGALVPSVHTMTWSPTPSTSVSSSSAATIASPTLRTTTVARANRATSAPPAGSGAIADVTPRGPGTASRAELSPSRPLAAVTDFARRVDARTPSPAVTAMARDGDDISGLRRGRTNWSVAQRCEDHIGALYARAYPQLGDRTAAEDAVLTAVPRAAGLPATLDGVTVSVWHVLAAHFDDQSDLICIPDGGVGPFPERHGRGRDAAGAIGPGTYTASGYLESSEDATRASSRPRHLPTRSATPPTVDLGATGAAMARSPGSHDRPQRPFRSSPTTHDPQGS